MEASRSIGEDSDQIESACKDETKAVDQHDVVRRRVVERARVWRARFWRERWFCMTWVRLPCAGRIAQSVEHSANNAAVQGSSPCMTILPSVVQLPRFFLRF